MGMSEYVRELRRHVGHGLLLVPGVTAVVRNDAGELLLGRRADTGTWSLIAGTVVPGEETADAAVREAREEAGVDVVVERLAGVAMHPVAYPNGDRCEYLNL